MSIDDFYNNRKSQTIRHQSNDEQPGNISEDDLSLNESGEEKKIMAEILDEQFSETVRDTKFYLIYFTLV